MSVIIYSRISSKAQSLEAQTSSCKDYCVKNNLTVTEIITETGSGRSMKNLKKLRKLITGSKNITILVYSVDRFSRNTADALNFMKILDSNNINLISVADNIDLSSGSGRHSFRMRVSAAELEIDLLSERVKRSIAFKRSRGDFIGVAPYGYKTQFIGKRFCRKK